MMEPEILYRQVTCREELEVVRALEQEIWDMAFTPVLLTLTNVLNGGLTIGAWHGDRLVGFSYGFPGFRDGQVYLCSHMLGVQRDFRHLGIGFELKKQQRQMAIEMGYPMITWTFDPLESVNANLNLNKLNGICSEYDENHYGMMKDGLNDGLPSDRFILEWWIQSEYSHMRPEWLDCIEFSPDAICLEAFAKPGGLPRPGALCTPKSAAFSMVPIPLTFQEIKRADFSLAQDWRMQVRAALVGQLEQGRVVTRLLRQPEKGLGWYLCVNRFRIMAAIEGTTHE